jgi:hypothetical protein
LVLALVLHMVHLAWSPVIVGTVLYFLLFTLLLHRWQESALRTDPKVSVRRFMSGLVIKMMASLMVLLVTLLVLPRPERLVFAMVFAGLYLAHLGFSTVRLQRLIRQPQHDHDA